MLENYLTSLAYERGLADNTLMAYRRDLGQYLAVCGGRSGGMPPRWGRFWSGSPNWDSPRGLLPASSPQ